MHIGLLVKKIDNMFKCGINQQLAQYDVTISQFHIMAYLYDHQDREVNPIDIQKFMNITKPTVSGILKRLEEKEFIEFQSSKKDHRFKQIILKEKAFEIKKAVDDKIDLMEKQICTGLSEEELDHTKEILEIMLDNLLKMSKI